VERRHIDLHPEGLEVTLEEREFMKRLAPLVGTPRSAKRLTNTDRLIRAPLSGDDLRQFLGTAASSCTGSASPCSRS
jgi:hypothetical protein